MSSPYAGLNLTASTEDTKSIDTWIDENSGTGATSNMMKIDTSLSNMSDLFSASTSYVTGQYVFYNNLIYKFTANHPAGSWIGTDATAVKLANEIKTNSEQISQLADLSTMSFLVTDVDTSTQYAFGLQIKDGKTQLMYEEVV